MKNPNNSCLGRGRVGWTHDLSLSKVLDTVLVVTHLLFVCKWSQHMLYLHFYCRYCTASEHVDLNNSSAQDSELWRTYSIRTRQYQNISMPPSLFTGWSSGITVIIACGGLRSFYQWRSCWLGAGSSKQHPSWCGTHTHSAWTASAPSQSACVWPEKSTITGSIVLTKSIYS